MDTVITLAELTAGVLAAANSDIRAQRLLTLEAVADMTTLPVDEEAARTWARRIRTRRKICSDKSVRPVAFWSKPKPVTITARKN